MAKKMEFWLVLAGGAASTLGALIVAKRTETRRQRAHIYDDLLPPLLKYVGEEGWEGHTLAQDHPHNYRELLQPIIRAGHVAGGRDAKKVDGLREILTRWAHASYRGHMTQDDSGGFAGIAFDSDEDDETYRRLNVEFLDAVDSYRQWLSDRLRWPV